MTEAIILIIFSFLLLHYCAFLLTVNNGLKKLKLDQSKKNKLEYISVIVPFRNESNNILVSLSSLQNQTYPRDKYEVIFVNDSSTDDSLYKISSQQLNSNIQVVSVPDNYSVNAHKKRAIRFGITLAKGSIIFTTDADCIQQPEWLEIMYSYFDEKAGFVSGPVEFVEEKSFFSKIQKLEFAGLVITGAGLIGAGKPTICNAANIAYRKEVYEKVGGFEYQMSLSSGDDELLMQKIHSDTDYKIRFAANERCIVNTNPNKNISEFYQQRKRWASKGLFYNNNVLIVKLILIYLFYISLLAQLLLGIFYSSSYLLTFLFSLIIKFYLEYQILQKGSDLIFNKLSLKYFFPTQFLQIPYIVLAGLAGAIGNFTWKGRKISR